MQVPDVVFVYLGSYTPEYGNARVFKERYTTVGLYEHQS